MYMNYDFKSMFKPDEILVYLRKSRSDDPMLSVEQVLEKHETILNAWADLNLDGIIPESNKFREVVSGETIEDRPEIQKILKLIENPRIKAILTVEVQRLSRGDLEDAGRLMKLLRFTNTYIITPSKTYDLQDEYDRDIFERELKRGNEYLEYSKKIMNRGRVLSSSQGNFIGSKPAYGYNKIWVSENGRKCPVLAINEEQASVVRTIFDMYVNENKAFTAICRALDEMGVPSIKSKHWMPTGVKSILTNEVYIGKIKWGLRKEETIVEDGEIKTIRRRLKYGNYPVYEGKHEPIISEELFNAAQERIGKNTRCPGRYELVNPLAGLLYCQCGTAMTLRKYKDKDGNKRCESRLICEDQRHCHTGSCTFDEMINMICNVLEQNIRDFQIQIDSGAKEREQSRQKFIQSLEKKLHALEEKEINMWDAQYDPDPANRLPKDIFLKLNEKLQNDKSEVKRALKRVYETPTEYEDYENKIVTFHKALDALQNDNIDAKHKNNLLKACIGRIEYFRNAPQRLKRTPGEKKGTTIKTPGGHWTVEPIELNVKLKT